MGKPTGFMEIPRETAPRRPVAERLHDYREVYNPFPILKLQEQGGALHGLRHSLLSSGLPAREPDPRLERPRLSRPVAHRDRPSPRHEQLPRVHRHPLPRALRGLVRPGDQQRPRDDQADRAIDRRPRLGRGLDRPQAARGEDREDRRRRRLGPRRPRRGPAARAGRARRHRLRARRPDRRPAPLRHPRLQDGEVAARPAAGADGGRGRRLPAGRQRRRRHRAEAAPRRVRRRLPLRRRDPGARPADRGSRPRGHPLRDGVPPAPEQARCGGRHPRRVVHLRQG